MNDVESMVCAIGAIIVFILFVGIVIIDSLEAKKK